MKGPTASRRLSAVDAAFLYLERKEIPLHIASVSVFEGALPFDEFVSAIESKLHLIPRYRQRVAAAPFNIGHPTWEDDPGFDIRRHIFRVPLDPPGGEPQLEALAGRVLTELMDRAKPLWDITVVEGVEGGRTALISRVHHALADGIAGISLMNIILDPTPEGSRVPAKRQRFRAAPPPPAAQALTEAIGSAVYGTLENFIQAQATLLDLAQGLFSDTGLSNMRGLLGLLPELAGSVERLPFNRPCTGDRLYCWAEFPFENIRAIRAAAGGTVNDVILTVLTRALSLYVKQHGETVANRFVRVVCPVNTRRQEHNGDLGNRVSFMPVSLPLATRDAVQLLHQVSRRTEIMKNARVAELVSLVGSWLGAAPPPLQSLLWWGIPIYSMPLPLFNLICTNVPGPQMPLYALGRRMLTYCPYVPTGYEMGVGCAVESYDGRIFYGLTADSQACPDVTRLRDFLRVAFDELCHGAGLKRTTARRRVAKPAVSRKATPPAPETAASPQAQPLVQTASTGA